GLRDPHGRSGERAGRDRRRRPRRLEKALPAGQRQREGPGAGDQAVPERGPAPQAGRRARGSAPDRALAAGDRTMTPLEQNFEQVKLTARAIRHKWPGDSFLEKTQRAFAGYDWGYLPLLKVAQRREALKLLDVTKVFGVSERSIR